MIGNDMIAIPKPAKNPVLAHHFLNYLLDEKHGYDNFVNFIGYQPPFTSLDPDRLVTDEVVPENLEYRGRARERLRRRLPARRALAAGPDPLAERLGRVQGGCLTPTRGSGPERGRPLLGRARAARDRLARHLLPRPVLRHPRRRVRDRSTRSSRRPRRSGTRSTGTPRRSSSSSTSLFTAGGGVPDGLPADVRLRRDRRRSRSSSPTRSRTTSRASAAAGRGCCSPASSRRSSSATSCGCSPGSTCSRTTAG